jgi:4-hydroxybenzoate polyprenyltransferase
MNEKQESTLSIIAGLFVLFTALLAPPVAAALAIFLLVVFAVYKLLRSRQEPK